MKLILTFNCYALLFKTFITLYFFKITKFSKQNKPTDVFLISQKFIFGKIFRRFKRDFKTTDKKIQNLIESDA